MRIHGAITLELTVSGYKIDHAMVADLHQAVLDDISAADLAALISRYGLPPYPGVTCRQVADAIYHRLETQNETKERTDG